MVLKADKRCHDIRWYRSRFLQTVVVIFPQKSTQVKIHTKMAIFWLVFSAKNPVKSDKLALIEGKILNLMFLDINIPVVNPLIFGFEYLTHNQRQRTPKVASVNSRLISTKIINEISPQYFVFAQKYRKRYPAAGKCFFFKKLETREPGILIGFLEIAR